MERREAEHDAAEKGVATRGSTPSLRSYGWYVVQVRTGHEERACKQINRACAERDKSVKCDTDKVLLRECFNPRFASQKKWKGSWQDFERSLLPGYVIAVAVNPSQLAEALREVREPCRILSFGETYASLDGDERDWIDEQKVSKNHVIPMSFGQKNDDGTIQVTAGPLKGREAMVTGYDRQNGLASIELHMGQITIKSTIGLAIMPSGKVRQL